MSAHSNSGQTSFGDNREFNGVKVFSATMVHDRERLGETVTSWLHTNPDCEVRDIVVTQSSDEAFHCVAITVFYWQAG